MVEKARQLRELTTLVAGYRRHRRLSLRAAAQESGVSFNTLARVEKGHIPDLRTLGLLADWLGEPIERFVGEGSRRAESTPETIAQHLRADPHLPDEAARQIEQIVRQLYGALADDRDVVAVHLRAARTFRPAASAALGELLTNLKTALENEE